MKKEVEKPHKTARSWYVTLWIYAVLTAFVVFMFGYSIGAGDAKVHDRLNDIERTIENTERSVENSTELIQWSIDKLRERDAKRR